MTVNGWVQILLFAAIIFAITKPLGSYMYRVFEGDRQPLPRLFGAIEGLLYKLCGVDAQQHQIGAAPVERVGRQVGVHHRRDQPDA